MSNVYEIITEKVIEHLENGTVPWRKPWKVNASKLQNLHTGKPYRGINVFLLQLASLEGGFTSPYWLSFKQAKDRGGSVKKGEKSTVVVYWRILRKEVTDEKTGELKTVTIPLLKYHRVFNLEQTEDVKLPKRVTEAATESTEHEENVDAEKIIEGYTDGPTISENGDRAFWQPGTDHVTVPPRASFDTPDNFYVTTFHELGHSTGSKDRLNRKTDDYSFNTHTRGREELVAEMTAAFLSAEAGIESTLELNAAYIQSWINEIREDTKAVVVAASQAHRAADWIMGRREKSEEE